MAEPLPPVTDDDEPDDEPPHVGHWPRFGGGWWCDTCNSPYCERA